MLESTDLKSCVFSPSYEGEKSAQGSGMWSKKCSYLKEMVGQLSNGWKRETWETVLARVQIALISLHWVSSTMELVEME